MIKTHNKWRQRITISTGFTLIELLIAMLLLALGLLSLAFLQLHALKGANSAGQRTAATLLTMDIIDRMRSTMTASPDNNLPPVVDGAFHNIDTNVVLSCGGCSVAQQDLKDWTTALHHQLGGAGNAWWAQIEQVGGAYDGVYTVTLMWDDERSGATGTDCSGAATAMVCLQTLFQP